MREILDGEGYPMQLAAVLTVTQGVISFGGEGEALIMRQLVHNGIQRGIEPIDLLEHGDHQLRA